MKNVWLNVLVAVVSTILTIGIMQYSGWLGKQDKARGAEVVLVKQDRLSESNEEERDIDSEWDAIYDTDDYIGQATPKEQQLNAAVAGLPDFREISKRTTPAVVNITIIDEKGYRVASGSGVTISSDGYIITNQHVVEDAKKIEVTFPNKKQYSAALIGNDPTTDLALLKINATGLPMVYFGNSDEVSVGEWVLAVGNPFNLTSTVTAGIVSAKGRNIDILESAYAIESFIQTDAVVNPGNSGGALLNTAGELIGINTAIITESGGYEGYSFAIPSNLVRKIMLDLREYGKVQRAVLGVEIQEVNSRIAKEAGLRNSDGVLITRISEGGSAEEAGLQMGDIILSIDNKKVTNVPQLQEQVARYRPGDNISLEYFRNGRRLKENNVELRALLEN